MPYEVEIRLIDGVMQRVYKNLWSTLRELWLWTCSEHGLMTYIVYEDQRLTYGDVLEQSVRTAAMLRNLYDVKKGDRIAICSHNLPQCLIIFWACQLIGAVSTFVNMWVLRFALLAWIGSYLPCFRALPLQPLLHCFSLTGSTVIFTDSERANRVCNSTQHLREKGVRGIVVLDSLVYDTRWTSFDLWGDVLQSVEVDKQAFLSQDPGLGPEDDATIIFTSGTYDSALLSSRVALHQNLSGLVFPRECSALTDNF